MSTLKTNAIVDAAGGNTATINGGLPLNATSLRTELNATGSAPVYACRAWVNFNGVTTVTIRANGNVSSVVRNATGDYTINFATALPDANYAVVFGGGGSSLTNISSGMLVIASASAAANLKTTTQLRIQIGSSANGVPADNHEVSVAIFR